MDDKFRFFTYISLTTMARFLKDYRWPPILK